MGTVEALNAVGVGVGPFNLGLAALADGVPELAVRCYDARPAFRWHPGMMVPGATLQVNFLADLVTLVEPTSRWSFLCYLRARDRMYPFYIAERFHMPRREYDDYCRWVAGSLPSCVFGTRVRAVEWRDGAFTVTVERTGDGATGAVRARAVVLGVGTEPAVPAALMPALGARVFHSADYLDRLAGLDGCRHVTVVGSGQSGAEVFLDLLRRQPDVGWAVSWLTRSPAFAPLDYSKLVLEYTTPDYVRYFHGLPDGVREPLLRSQWQLYKAISTETLEAVFAELYEHTLDGTRPTVELRPTLAVDRIDRDAGRLTVSGVHTLQQAPVTVVTDAVVLATGYTARFPACLAPVEHLLELDDRGRLVADLDYRVRCAPELAGRLFVQNAELHTHGAATPDLGIGAYRNATILNQIVGREVFSLPKRTAFTTFAAR